MKKLLLLFLLVSQGLFSQTQTEKSKTISKQMLQGKWISAESKGALQYEFKGDNLLITQGDSVLFTCNNFELMKKAIDTHCPGKEELIFKIKSISDSTLYMKSMSSDYYHKYVKAVKK